MTLKLNSTPEQLVKNFSGGHSFTLTERVEGSFKFINTPKLLTSILTPSINTHRGKSFLYDVEQAVQGTFTGKSYSAKGDSLEKPGASQLAFGIPSFGLTWNVLPGDFAGKRIPNGEGFMDAAYIATRQAQQAMNAMDILNEVGMAELLVNDRNYLAGGNFTQYDYSAKINGASRATAKDLTLGSDDIVATRQILAKERKLIEQALGVAGKSARGFMLICGDTLFEKLWDQQAQTGLARPLMNTLDLASMQMPTMFDGTFRYDNFSSEAGMTIVNYGASIIGGSKMIGDDNGYLVAVGVEDAITIELAPADTMDTVNQEAEAMYMFTEEGLRTGISTEIETNRLFLNRNPELIRAVTSST